MELENTQNYLAALFEPLKYWLLSYDSAGGGENHSTLCSLLDADENENDWERIILEEKSVLNAQENFLNPFECVCLAFALNPFEAFALKLTLACQMDARFHAALRLFGASHPTFGLAVRIFSKNPQETYYWRAAWEGGEKKLELLFSEPISGNSLPLTLRKCVFRFLLGLDFGIDGVEAHYPGVSKLHDLSEIGIYKSILAQKMPPGAVTVLAGKKGVGKKYQLRLLSESLGVPVFFSDTKAAREKDLAAALIISGALLCVKDAEESEDLVSLLKHTVGYAGHVFLTTQADNLIIPDEYMKSEFKLISPGAKRRRVIWEELLRKAGYNTDATEVSAKYGFTIGRIESALYSAILRMRGLGCEALTPQLLDDGCRDRLTHAMSKLIKPVPAVFTWNDLVLTPARKQALMDACDRVRLGALVYEDWGFGHKLPYGRGLRVLFTGPPGTGKTMAAQVMANELKMELYKVDISSLVSKYIGETEKNLASVFDSARRSGGILFFDEADALFGKRGEQKDSNDRFANMQTAYLLQAVEDYEGVLILATNLVQNFDPAFVRRIHTRVDFVPPTRDERLEIWEKLLKEGAPIDSGLDWDYLAGSFELTGAEIKNIVLAAAFLAAAQGKKIGMDELIKALLTEYAKSGKIISGQELGEYGESISI